MKNTIIAITLLFLSSCHNEETMIVKPIIPLPNAPDPNCVDTAIIPKVNVANSPDLIRYLYHHNSFICSAVKSVPTQGYIDWIGNAYIENHKGKYGIGFYNYIDTSLSDRKFRYAWSREIFGCGIVLDQLGKQYVTTDGIAAMDSTMRSGFYLKATADGDVIDASWNVNQMMQNYIEVTCINWDARIIEGRFELHYTLTEPSQIPGVKYADNASFRCGNFRAMIP